MLRRLHYIHSLSFYILLILYLHVQNALSLGPLEDTADFIHIAGKFLILTMGYPVILQGAQDEKIIPHRISQRALRFSP